MTEKQIAEKEKIKLSELTEGSKREKLDKTIRFIQENAGGLTLLTTVAVAFGSALIRYILYLIEFGKTIYHHVPRSLIDVSGDNILYDFFVKGIVVLIFLLFNLIPYCLWKSDRKTCSKIGWSLLLVLSPDLLGAFILVVSGYEIQYSLKTVLIWLFVGALVGVGLFYIGLSEGIRAHSSKKEKSEPKPKRKKNKPNFGRKAKYAMIILAGLFAMESLIFIVMGWFAASTPLQFKIIERDDRTYAVIYENSETYVITECEVEDKQITFFDKNTRQEIKKDDVKYTLQSLIEKENPK